MALRVWMRIGQPLEPVLDDFDRFLDRMLEGGVTDLLVGRMQFVNEDYGKMGWVPTFSPNLELYRSMELAAPPETGGRAEGYLTTYGMGGLLQAPEMGMDFGEKVEKLDRAFEAAKGRGVGLYIFSPNGPSPGGFVQEVSLIEDARLGHCLNDPRYLAYYMARTQDTLEHYPGVDGFVTDDPEFGYELKHSDRSGIFKCFCPCCEEKAGELGYDFEAMKAAAERLLERLHQLRPEDVKAFVGTQTGTLDLLDFLVREPDLLRWLRFKTDCVTLFVKTVDDRVKALGGEIRWGISPRTASFAHLTGHNLTVLGDRCDFQCPKLYIWMRGVDGMYGTVHRYAETLMRWNPDLPEDLCLALLFKLFGFVLPGVRYLADLERGFPEAFFAETLVREVEKNVERVGDPERIVAWVDAGESPHGGDPVGTDALRGILAAAEEGGMKAFIYHNYGHLQDEEWEVIREFTT